MLKFVSTKPPKGKEGHSPIDVPHKQARETFRLKDPSDEGRLQYFEAGEEDGRDTSTGTSEKISSQGEVLDSTVYDNYDNLQSTKSSRKRRVKSSEHSQKRDVSGTHVTGPRTHATGPRTHVTGSRTPSISSADSGLGYPQRTSQDSLDAKRFGYRHVTWSPDVSNGEASKYDSHVDVQIKDKKKSRGMIESGKKSIQGISKFLMGDKHYKKNSKLEKSDKLHSKGKIASHAVINDYLATVQQEKKEDDKTSATVNISKPSPSTDKFQKSGSSQSSIPVEDVNEDDTRDYYDNRETGQSQAKPTVFHQPKRVILAEHNGLQKFISLPTLAESQMERQDDKSSKFLFSPLYSSTPKRQYRRSEEFLPKNLKNKMVSSPAKPKEMVIRTADHEEHKIDQSAPVQVAPKTVTSLAPVMTATSRVSGTFNKGNAKKPLDSKYNAVQVGTTWSQHRPYSADYEEIPRTFDHLDVSESGHLSKSHGDLHLQSSSFEEPRLPPKWLRRPNYPRLHLPRMQPFPQHSSAGKKEKESRSEFDVQKDRNEMAYAKLGSPTKQNNPQHVKDLQGLKELEEVMTSCVPQVNHEVNKYDSVKRFPVSREFPVSSNTSSNHTPGMSSYTHVVNRSRDYQPMEDEQVDLVYITERIISMSFQSDGQESLYQSNVQEVFHMLRMKHGENVLVINISEPRDDLQKANNQRVIDYGWPDHIAPPLERLCNICKSIDSWLNSDPNHVILLHCKGGRARLGVIIAAFMHYSSICASSDQAMDRMAMNRFFEGKLGGLSYPSHQRYVQYFSGLLSSAIKINSNPLYLHHLVIHGVPNFDSRGGCRPFIKVYQGMQPIFTSGVYNVTDQMQKVCISISPGIPLRGDIMIKCYHKNAASGQREPIWRCQFHTCAISNYNLLFSKSELDDAINDPRFPDQGKVEFVFGPNQDANVPVLDFKSDVTVPVDDNTDGLVRWDSYENFKHVDGYTKTDDINHNGIQRLPRMHHSEGPVDGGLYATVNKRKHEFVREEVVTHNGTQYNGSPHTSSDSGISAHSGIIGNSTHSPQYMQNDSRTQKNYSSMNSDSRQYGSHNYSTSSSTKQTVPPLDEQTQLDNILSDLLNDQVFVTSPKSGSSTMSKETRTFRTYETQRGPDGKTINQSAEVTYKLPSEVKEERHYTIKTEKDSKSSYMPTNAFSYTPTSPELARKVDSPKTSTLPYRTDYDNRYHKETSYSYNTVDGRSVSDSDNSWLQQQQRKLREKKDVRDDQRVQQEKKLVEELRTAQNRYLTKRAKSEEEERNVMDSYNTVSNGPSSTSPPGYSYSMSRSHTYSSEKSPGSFSSGDSSFDSKITKRPPSPGLTRVTVQTNSAPISPPLRSSSKDFMQRSRAASTSSSWQSQFPQKFVRQNSDVTFDRRNDIQPPVIRQITITTPPRSRRPFSPTYQTSTYRYSDRSASSLSPPIQRKTYQQEHISPVMSSTTKSSYQQSYSTSGNDHLRSKSLPRHAPTKTKVTEIHEASLPEGQKKSHYITEVYVHRSPGNEDGKATDNKQFVGKFEESRTTSERSEKVDHESNRLEELEKSLKAASNSIIATQQPWQQSVSPTGGFTQEHVVTRRTETRKYETNYQQQQQAVSAHHDNERHGNGHQSPVWDNYTSHVNVTQIQRPPSPPRQTRTVEEDRFSLRPIGPGMQALEPEGSPSSVGTLNRSTTPSFPISPVASAEQLIQSVHERVRRMSMGSMQDLSTVTPPFPVTPRTPYVNPASPSTLSPAASRNYYGKMSPGSYQGLPFSSGSYHQEDSNEAYNRIISRQLSRGSDPLYASIPDNIGRLHMEGNQQTLQKQTQQTQQQQQFQYQTQQQQHFQTTQQYQTHHQTESMAHNGGPLHVDTSPRMLSAGTMSRSPGSPHSPETLSSLRQQLNVANSMSTGALSPGTHSMTGQSSPSVYFGLSRRGSLTSIADSVDATHATPRFVKDTSKFWYKPNITREEAIQLLKDKAPGTFVVRDSNSFPGAFGLALKVATIPPNVQTKSTGDPAADLVRHFLIEPTPKGVRLRGCNNEPVFGSLASLVYQHSLTPLALPCKLSLPEVDSSLDTSTMDSSVTSEIPSSAAALLAQGAACNVLYLNSVDTESLTGPQAVSKAIKQTLDTQPQIKQTVVHFKVSNQGITLTDNQRKLFFRRHYPVATVTYCGMDPDGRKWSRESDVPGVFIEARIFGFVARKQGGVSDNACHLFAELDPEQPASAIVNFVTKVMIGQGKVKS